MNELKLEPGSLLKQVAHLCLNEFCVVMSTDCSIVITVGHVIKKFEVQTV